MRVPLAAIGSPWAVSSAEAAAYSCEVLQMPQMRGAMTSASSGSRPARDLLEAAEHRADAPCVGHVVPRELEPDLHVALDAIELHPDRAPLKRHRAPSYVGAQAPAAAGRRCLNSAFDNGNFGPMQP
jgi:hypothetical protein